VFITLFTFEAFRIPYWPRKTRGRVVYVICACIIAANILIYLISPNAPGNIIYLSMIPFALLVADAARRMFKEKQASYMGLYLIALFLFFFWGISAKLFLDNTFYVPAVLSNIFMALAQSVVLAIGYADAKNKAAELTAETEFYRRMSHDLRTPLTRISTNIQIANRQQETDHERLTKSQDEIMGMADMIDTALGDSIERGADR
jgi:signal transduction histidine kinase